MHICDCERNVVQGVDLVSYVLKANSNVIECNALHQSMMLLTPTLYSWQNMHSFLVSSCMPHLPALHRRDLWTSCIEAIVWMANNGWGLACIIEFVFFILRRWYCSLMQHLSLHIFFWRSVTWTLQKNLTHRGIYRLVMSQMWCIPFSKTTSSYSTWSTIFAFICLLIFSLTSYVIPGSGCQSFL